MALSAKSKQNSNASQTHFDFGQPDFAPENFMHGRSNASAVAALKTWQTWPGGVYALCGEIGAGKSHLARIWAESAEAVRFLGPLLSAKDVAELAAQDKIIALIDNADACDEITLFNLLTTLERQGGGVLLVGATPPAFWPYELLDLKSRLASIAYETMAQPDAPILAQIIVRRAAAAGFLIDDGASQYLSERIPRTFKAARDVVACMHDIDRATLKSPKALAQRALHALYTLDDYSDPETTPDLFD